MNNTLADTIVDFVPFVDALIAKYTKISIAAQQKKIIPSRLSIYTQKKRNKRNYSSACSLGDRLLQKMRSALHFFDSTNDYERSAHQRQFHESMIAACIRHIYADEFADNFVQILEDNNWTSARQEIMICCPRRFGKTWAVGMFCAAYLYSIPSCEICIFSRIFQIFC